MQNISWEILNVEKIENGNKFFWTNINTSYADDTSVIIVNKEDLTNHDPKMKEESVKAILGLSF